MRIMMGLPPLEDPRGFHQLMANRQAQIFKHRAFIYPYVVAMAATVAQAAGHEVRWVDGEAEGLSWADYVREVDEFKPDWIVWEGKTPAMPRLWELSLRLKGLGYKVCLMGDHVTALPEESLQFADAVMVGGMYEQGVLNLVNNSANSKILQANDIDLKSLPLVDRVLTKWWLYGYQNGSGNYKYLPGTHSMIGRDCWWRHEGGCTFCSWTGLYPKWQVGTVDQLMAEVENCARLGIRELFDDTGTFPIGSWLEKFCKELRKFNGGNRHRKAKVTLGINMRPGALTRDQWQMLGASGFRFILFGLESANQATVDRINKGQKEGDIEKCCRLATEAGLDAHATAMTGYVWESAQDARNTINLTRSLFEKGWLKTLQATIVIPYPGTQLFEQAEKEGWLKYGRDWQHYGMDKPVMTCPMSDQELLSITRGIYKSYLRPRTIVRRVMQVRSRDDLAFIGNGAKKFLGHLSDFGGKR